MTSVAGAAAGAQEASMERATRMPKMFINIFLDFILFSSIILGLMGSLIGFRNDLRLFDALNFHLLRII